MTAMDPCHYSNSSGRMVILRCIGPDAFFQEKVIFPFDDWFFCSPLHSRIEIWSHGPSGAELLDVLPAAELKLTIDVLQAEQLEIAGTPAKRDPQPRLRELIQTA